MPTLTSLDLYLLANSLSIPSYTACGLGWVHAYTFCSVDYFLLSCVQLVLAGGFIQLIIPYGQLGFSFLKGIGLHITGY